MNTEKYCILLGDGLIYPLLEAPEDGSQTSLANPASECIFMQDNAPSHSAVATKEFFDFAGVKYMEWRGQSPGLNPIENLWAIIKQKVLKTIPGLDLVVEKEWRNIDRQHLINLAQSLPNRIQLVLQNKGYTIPY